jgi:hypothetical protein
MTSRTYSNSMRSARLAFCRNISFGEFKMKQREDKRQDKQHSNGGEPSPPSPPRSTSYDGGARLSAASCSSIGEEDILDIDDGDGVDDPGSEYFPTSPAKVLLRKQGIAFVSSSPTSSSSRKQFNDGPEAPSRKSTPRHFSEKFEKFHRSKARSF